MELKSFITLGPGCHAWNDCPYGVPLGPKTWKPQLGDQQLQWKNLPTGKPNKVYY